MARVFLSYAREDVAAAQAFADVLERAGHEVWWDRHIRAGSRFSRDIASALKKAEAVIVLWSKTSTESAWVQDEAAEGLEEAHDPRHNAEAVEQPDRAWIGFVHTRGSISLASNARLSS